MARGTIVGTWDGGFIRLEADGRKVYWIRKSVNGIRREVSTRCTKSSAAEKHWERFQKDPLGYKPEGDAPPEALLFTEDLLEEFLAWSRDTVGNTGKYVGQQRIYLKWWGRVLDGKDLRSLSLARDILAPLSEKKARAMRIRQIKRLFSYLVGERHLLKPAEDPTFRTLRAPQARPEQARRVKAFGPEDFKAVRAHLVGHWRDGLDVLAGTGWHVEELGRFARGGEIAKHRQRGTPVLVCQQSKVGDTLRTEVSEEVALAGARLLERGTFDRDKFDDAIAAAAAAAGVDLTAGRFRHSVATWAIDAGEDIERVSQFLNHKDARTTRRFYATHATPRKVPTLL
jgi:integrase